MALPTGYCKCMTSGGLYCTTNVKHSTHLQPKSVKPARKQPMISCFCTGIYTHTSTHGTNQTMDVDYVRGMMMHPRLELNYLTIIVKAYTKPE